MVELKNQTKDGVVSLDPRQLKELVSYTKMNSDDLKDYIDENIPNFEELLGLETRDLSHTELLNRDYYRGRFASKNRQGKFIYNWEDDDIS